MIREVARPVVRPAWHPLARGVLGGLSAGVVFLAAESLIGVALGKTGDYYLRLLASLVLGFPALVPAYRFAMWPLVGLLIHGVMTAAAGGVFALSLSLMGVRRSPAAVLVALGAAYGALLWTVDYGLFIPFFLQLSLMDRFWNGFFAHTVFFGAPLGYAVALLDRAAARETGIAVR